MDLVIDYRGSIQCIYSEAIPLDRLGEVTIRRASYVEPDARGWWWADMGPVGGPALGPYYLRSQALEAERNWLLTHWLPNAWRNYAHPPVQA